MNPFEKTTSITEEYPGCTVEDLGRGGFRMLQSKDGFRFGTDTVLLSWFAASYLRSCGGQSSPRALELGANCGAASLCLCARKPQVSVDAVEIMPEAFGILCGNIRLNSLEKRMSAYLADIRDLPEQIKKRQYELIFFNPPFFSSSEGPVTASENTGRRTARFEENGTAEDFIAAAAARVLPASGYAVMVMRASKTAASFAAFEKAGLTPVGFTAVHPFADRKAGMFLLAGKRGNGRTEMKILPPIVLNKKDSDGCTVPTERILEIYGEEHKDCFI